MATREEIAKVYVATFSRAADADGLAYWISDGTPNTTSLTDLEEIAAAMTESAEYQALYAGLDREATVTAMYQNLFNRAPDAEGLDYWVNGDGSTVSIDKMIIALINGAQGDDVTIMDNKATVGLAFADAGLNDVELAKEVVAVVTEDPTTVTAAEEQINDTAKVAAYESALSTYETAVAAANEAIATAQAAAADVSTVELANQYLSAAQAAQAATSEVVTAAANVVVAAAATNSTDDDAIAQEKLTEAYSLKSTADTIVTEAEAAVVEAEAEAADVAAYEAAVTTYMTAKADYETKQADADAAKADAEAAQITDLASAEAALTLAQTAVTAATAASEAATVMQEAAQATVNTAAATNPTDDDTTAATYLEEATVAVSAATATLEAAKAVETTAQTAIDNATPQTFTVEADATTVIEGNAITFTVTADHPRDIDVDVQYSIEGVTTSAAAAADPLSDVGVLNGTVTIPAGETTATITITPADDANTEGFEAFKVNLLDDNFNVATSSGAVVIQDAPNSGQTFTLTTGVDSQTDFTGGIGNDIYNAVIDGANSTLTALDYLDGGDGNDVLNINDVSDPAAGINLSQVTIKNIETLNIASINDVDSDGAGAALDMSSIVGLETVNITKAVSANVKVSSTTDLNISGVTDKTATDGGANVVVTQKLKDATTSGIQVNSAENVTITATDSDTTTTATLGINVGADAETAATGTVDITATGKAYVAGASLTLQDITVYGGTSVNITQVATSDDSAAATDTGAGTTVQGDITVYTTNDTTDITIKQDAAVTAVDAAYTTGAVTETASVKFAALTTGQTLIAGGLTLTAAADMTAEEVAAAFANLVNDAAKGTLLLAGDTQSAAAYTNATYSGNFSNWTSGAADGDTVVFTSTTANIDVTDLTFTGTGTAPTVTTTQGKANDATMAGGVMGITAGVVTITGGTTADALKTVTVDGFAANSAIAGTTTALETLSLSNGVDFTTSNAAATLNLTLENINGNYTQTAGAATLNVTSTGDNTADLDIANTSALTIDGTGIITASGGTTDISAVETLVVKGSAGVEFAVADATTALTSVDTTGTTGTVTIDIDDGTQASYAGGAGVDNVSIANAGTSVTKAISLGDGNDKLTLTGATVVVPTSTLDGGTGTDTLSIDATSAAALDGDTAFSSKLTGFERLEITSAGTQNIDVKNLGFADYVTVAGSSATTTLTNLANNAHVVINSAVITGITTVIENASDATLGTADVLNVEISNIASIAAGTLTAADIETVNVTTTDADTTDATVPVHTLTLKADTATTLNVDGSAGLTLTLDAATVNLTTINASAMTEGALTVTADGNNVMTITGGAGADVITASGTKADVINGGAGADTLTAGFNGAHLTGGAGNDLFVVAADSAVGNTQSNTYSYIEDFQAGDKIQLAYFDTDTDGTGTDAVAPVAIDTFTKLQASLDESTSTFSEYVDTAFTEMSTEGDAVWFMYGGSSYIVVDSNVSSNSYVAQTAFNNGEDLIVKVTGVDLTNASFNSDYGTIEIA